MITTDCATSPVYKKRRRGDRVSRRSRFALLPHQKKASWRAFRLGAGQRNCRDREREKKVRVLSRVVAETVIIGDDKFVRRNTDSDSSQTAARYWRGESSPLEGEIRLFGGRQVWKVPAAPVSDRYAAMVNIHFCPYFTRLILIFKNKKKRKEKVTALNCGVGNFLLLLLFFLF